MGQSICQKWAASKHREKVVARTIFLSGCLCVTMNHQRLKNWYSISSRNHKMCFCKKCIFITRTHSHICCTLKKTQWLKTTKNFPRGLTTTQFESKWRIFRGQSVCTGRKYRYYSDCPLIVFAVNVTDCPLIVFTGNVAVKPSKFALTAHWLVPMDQNGEIQWIPLQHKCCMNVM